MANFYSNVVATRTTNPAAPSTAVTSFELVSSPPDVDRLLSCTASVVIFRISFVGSMLGVTEIWNMGGSGVPSHMNKCSLYPAVGSWKILQPM